MIGWRIGWVCGHERIVRAFADVKDNSDSGQFGAIQNAAAFALDGDMGMREVLAGRDDVAEVEVTPDLGALDDVDTPEDHRRLRVRDDTPVAFRRSDGRSSAP